MKSRVRYSRTRLLRQRGMSVLPAGRHGNERQSIIVADQIGPGRSTPGSDLSDRHLPGASAWLRRYL